MIDCFLLFTLRPLVNIELLILFLENIFYYSKKNRILWKKRFINCIILSFYFLCLYFCIEMRRIKAYNWGELGRENMNILVAGGAGYIGTHTCVSLIEAGHEVIVVDNLSNSKLEAVKRVERITNHKI